MTDKDNSPAPAATDSRQMAIDLAAMEAHARRASAPDIHYLQTELLGPGLPPGIPITWNRNQNHFESVKSLIEEFRDRPTRRKGTAKATTIASFCDLVNRHKTDDSVLFVDTDWQKPAFLAVIDYHGIDHAADNLAHRVSYAFPLSDEWKFWTEGNGVKFDQATFAQLIENRIPDLATPTAEERAAYETDLKTAFATPSELITLSRGLSVTVEATVKHHQSLQSGEGEISFTEDHKGSDGKPMRIPGLFLLSIPPFAGGESVRIPARLRYRAAGGAVRWWFEMFRPDLFITQKIRAEMAAAAESTGLPVYEGDPEGA